MQRSSLIPLNGANTSKSLGEQSFSSLTLPSPKPQKNAVQSVLSQYSLPVSPISPESPLKISSISPSSPLPLHIPPSNSIKIQNTNKLSKSKLPPLSSSSSSSKVEELMKSANRLPEIEVKHPANEFTERSAALPINTGMSRVKTGPSTAEFSTFEGVSNNQDIEKALLDRGFISTEKILTKDDQGNIVCRFIKARDSLGHALYIELDTTQKDGMGYLSVSDIDTDNILTLSHEASVVPYSLKVGSFEASSSSLYGVGFECDNQVCVMSRKDSSLEPVETIFSYSQNTGNDMGIQDRHPIPFPIVKLSEILADPKTVSQNIASSHVRMRNIAFTSCMKDVFAMKKSAADLQNEIERFDKISTEVSNVLSCTINELENMHAAYEKQGALRCEKDAANLRAIKFNLNKRSDLTSDYIALCHSMRERAQKIAILKEEIKALNDFSQTLFTGLSSVFAE
jgi:hypothetical protein